MYLKYICRDIILFNIYLIVSGSIFALFLCLQLAGMLKYFDAKIKLLIDPFFLKTNLHCLLRSTLRCPLPWETDLATLFLVSQGKACWQTSAGYGIISQDHKLSIELTFSSGLLCYPFLSSLSKTILKLFLNFIRLGYHKITNMPKKNNNRIRYCSPKGSVQPETHARYCPD